MSDNSNSNMTMPSHDGLLGYIERVESLLIERAGVGDEIKAVKAEAKAAGIDVKSMARMIKLRALGVEDRQYIQAVDDGYKAILGMLDGTPLGTAAVQRFEQARQSRNGTATAKPAGASSGTASGSGVAYSAFTGSASAPADQAEAPASSSVGAEKTPAPDQPKDTPSVAREKGREAGKNGKGVLENPYPARDPCRAAWEEGWCQTSGLTGMEVPSAWRPPEAKKADDEKGADGANGDADDGVDDGAGGDGDGASTSQGWSRPAGSAAPAPAPAGASAGTT